MENHQSNTASHLCILETKASSRAVHGTLPSTSHSWYCSEGQRHIRSFAYGVNFRHVFLPGEVLESLACKTACYSSLLGRLARVICKGAQSLDGHVPIQSRDYMVHTHGKHDASSQWSVQTCFTKGVLVLSPVC